MAAIVLGDPAMSETGTDPWMFHMRRGDFDAAWKISDAVLARRRGVPCFHLPRHVQYVWNGGAIGGRRVLVRCYHGLGDTIQFIRYMPLLRARARDVAVWVQPALIPLLDGIDGVDRFLALHDGAVDADFDVDVELMELPHLFRTTLSTIPRDVPYLRVRPAALPETGRLRVGIVWRSGEWALERSIPFRRLAPLLGQPVDWYVLQGWPGVAECPDDFGTRAGTTDIVELAATIRSLHLVISVDTMAAHLAGALGARVWTLLNADADWRWMTDRDDSPWYPTMRLFRQRRAGEWDPVIEKAARALGRIVERAADAPESPSRTSRTEDSRGTRPRPHIGP